jgi:hypothetical protein
VEGVVCKSVEGVVQNTSATSTSRSPFQTPLVQKSFTKVSDSGVLADPIRVSSFHHPHPYSPQSSASSLTRKDSQKSTSTQSSMGPPLTSRDFSTTTVTVKLGRTRQDSNLFKSKLESDSSTQSATAPVAPITFKSIVPKSVSKAEILAKEGMTGFRQSFETFASLISEGSGDSALVVPKSPSKLTKVKSQDSWIMYNINDGEE